MKHTLFLIVLIAFLPAALLAQKKNKKCNEGCAPKVSIYSVVGDSVKYTTVLHKDENRIKVILEGGIENIKHTVFVTSKNAIIRKDSSSQDEYIVIPQKAICEIIVDVKTLETYYSIKETEVNGKKVKEILKEYPPKTYMVGYERYDVK
jgi:hypothetical protein